MARAALRPDLVLHRPARGDEQWLLIEAKGGERRVERSARAAVLDLLAYRRAYDQALSRTHHYGLGVAFGADLAPNTDIGEPPDIAVSLDD
jgi:hypothetical protein